MEEKVIYQSQGQDVVGMASFLDGRPAIIFCHGYASNKDGREGRFRDIAAEMQDYSTLRFDFRSPKGGTYKPLAEQLPIESDEAPRTFTNMVSDIEASVEYAHSRGGGEIILFGHSLGGVPPLIYSARNGDSVRAVITVSAPCRILPRRLRVRDPGYWTLLKDIRKYDLAEAEALRGRIPHLVIHGEKDSVIRLRDGDARLLAEKTGGRLVIVPGANHDFDSGMELAIEESRKFLMQALD